jgi:hypothetical protein
VRRLGPGLSGVPSPAPVHPGAPDRPSGAPPSLTLSRTAGKERVHGEARASASSGASTGGCRRTPGNSGTEVVYLCREDCLKRLLEGVVAICDALRYGGPQQHGRKSRSHSARLEVDKRKRRTVGLLMRSFLEAGSQDRRVFLLLFGLCMRYRYYRSCSQPR